MDVFTKVGCLLLCKFPGFETYFSTSSSSEAQGNHQIKGGHNYDKERLSEATMQMVQLRHRTHLLKASDPKILSGKKGEGSTPDTWYDLE